ncbi:Lpp/OprI family alanine-zipper lipoprotein [Amphritea balenae]|nr:Lpp/OprI family alanine-zipper lipoprotein [Amphritea balenae]GGK60651.1 hypothetical protein GCM10007941_08620 [Amphritea balenae]
MKLITHWAAIAILAMLASGCATNTSEMDTIRSLAEQAIAQSERASAQAANAEAKADQAMKAANEAQQCCLENSEKIDRAFERTMAK